MRIVVVCGGGVGGGQHGCSMRQTAASACRCSGGSSQRINKTRPSHALLLPAPCRQAFLEGQLRDGNLMGSWLERGLVRHGHVGHKRTVDPAAAQRAASVCSTQLVLSHPSPAFLILRVWLHAKQGVQQPYASNCMPDCRPVQGTVLRVNIHTAAAAILRRAPCCACCPHRHCCGRM